jgi:hypothetical protein
MAQLDKESPHPPLRAEDYARAMAQLETDR